VRETTGETPLPAGGTTFLQARTANEVLKAQTNKVRLARLKAELVDRARAIAHVFTLARAERDAWLNWPARPARSVDGESQRHRPGTGQNVRKSSCLRTVCKAIAGLPLGSQTPAPLGRC
jgi:hypothetical protein